jgi:hypothetical protein
MGIFKNMIANINEVIDGDWGPATAPLVIWGRNNYNYWVLNKQTGVWEANVTTTGGGGVHNLWTYLFLPFNYRHYHNDSQYLRSAEDKIYSNSWAKGFKEEGFWRTHRPHSRLMVPLLSFVTPFRSHLKIGLHVRGTDRSLELLRVYPRLLDTVKHLVERGRANGIRDIVVFLSSDSWEQIKRVTKDLSGLGVTVAHLPQIGRSTTTRAIHLLSGGDPNAQIRPFLEATSLDDAEFYERCLSASPSQWDTIFQHGSGVSCRNVSLEHRVRPSYMHGSDSVMEVLMLSHAHFYVCMGGNFAVGPLLLRNTLPTYYFLTPHVLLHSVERMPNMVIIPANNTRPLTWPCKFDVYLKEISEKASLAP